MMGQLELFGTTSDASAFVSEIWGELTFYATRDAKWDTTCKHCLLLRSVGKVDECKDAPCVPTMRADGQCGYFGIKEMPAERRMP